MVFNIKTPQELYDEYLTVVPLNKNLFYKKSKLKYEVTELNDFDKFLDEYCPFLIKNGIAKDNLNSSSNISRQADLGLRQFINDQSFVIDLPEYGNDYVAYKPTDDLTNLNDDFEKILHRVGWKVTCVETYTTVDPESKNVLLKYAQFKLSPIEPIKK